MRPMPSRAPFAGNAGLLKLRFGVFDDSFLCRQHKEVNELNWNVMGRDRWKLAPAGGEFSYYTRDDQKNALAPDGPHGVSFEKAAAHFHITFMIGDGQPRHRGMDRIRDAGMACGYRLRVVAFEADADAVAGDGHERRRRAALPRRVRVGEWNDGRANRSGACSPANDGCIRSAPAARRPGSRSCATASCRGRRSSSRLISVRSRPPPGIGLSDRPGAPGPSASRRRGRGDGGCARPP